MPRVVPSSVVRMIEAMFPQVVGAPTSFPGFDTQSLPSLSALVKLVEAIPGELIVLPPAEYAELTASVAGLQAVTEAFQSSKAPLTHNLGMAGFTRNPIAVIHSALAKCPDAAASPDTPLLEFLGPETAFANTLRVDLASAHKALGNGEWKAATVLAGSLSEALLLWAVEHHDASARRQATERAAQAAGWGREPKRDPGSWGLAILVEVAAALECIVSGTAIEVRRTREYRNLIHPGVAVRTGQVCDLGTAHVAVGAVDHVIRDLVAERSHHRAS